MGRTKTIGSKEDLFLRAMVPEVPDVEALLGPRSGAMNQTPRRALLTAHIVVSVGWIALLLVATRLSVFKPRGLTRRGPPGSPLRARSQPSRQS